MRVLLVNKKILATAVAIAVSGGMTMSSSAYAGQSAVDGLYGKIRLGVRTSEYGGNDELDVISGKLVFGFKGKHDLDNGMQFSYGIEFEHDGADKETPKGSVTASTTNASGTGTLASVPKAGAELSNDKSWVALSGGFGKVILGEHSDMAGWACGGTDLLTHGTAEACELGHNTSPANAVQYRLSAGMFDFGFSYSMDGTTADANTLVGLQFSGDSWSVGGQFVDTGTGALQEGGVAPGDSGYAVGATWQLGNIGLGITVADNDVVDGFDLGLYMPLGPGNLAFVYSDIDVTDGTSYDFDYNVPMGGGAFWGVEYNQVDSAVEDRFTAYMGINF